MVTAESTKDPDEQARVPHFRKRPDRLMRTAAAFVIIALILAGLKLGAGVLVPVAEAIIVLFILNGLARAIRRIPIPWLQANEWVASVLAVFIVLILSTLAVYAGVQSALSFGPNAASLQNSLDPFITRLSELLGQDRANIIDRAIDVVRVEPLMQQIVLGFLALLNQFGVVVLYVLFLLADQVFFDRKMHALYPDETRRAEVTEILSDINRQISTYLWVMTRVSALTAILSYAVMRVAGLEHAEFWAVLVFVLNFIPTIGSILGTILPTAFALVQFQDLQLAALICIALGIVQFTIGNILFPRMAGSSLNLSFFVTIFCLFVWGALWGFTGMFLAVPLTAILVVLLARFEATRPLAVLMSKNGTLVDRPVPTKVA
ncbi:MAG: AI-2E family transporter [Pseudomonadota bacterium]